MKYFFLGLVFIIFFVIFIIYSPWFSFTKTLSSGDWPYLYQENIRSFEILKSPFIWLEPYYRLTAKFGVQVLSLSWETTEKIFWFFPFIFISLISSWVFVNNFLKKYINSSFLATFSIIGCLIYLTNTYALMIVGGGQMGVAMSYAFSPLTLYCFLIILINNLNFKNNKRFFLISILSSSIQIMFDPRLFVLVMFVVFIHFIYSGKFYRLSYLKNILLITIASISLNLFWIIPSFFGSKNIYNEVISINSINFLSFAKLSDAISLLQPNWPENIFGKVYFMRPEFILLPIIAFISLFFINKKESSILFFTLIALIGVFLSKGSNQPFGQIYLFLASIPLFGAFRDSTKFYLLIILSYSILIPYSLFKISIWINQVSILNKIKINTNLKKEILQFFIIILFISYWFFLIKPAWSNELNGTFKTRIVPDEYTLLKDFFKSKPESFSTLWLPQHQRFGFSSVEHPALNAQDFFNETNLNGILKRLKDPKTRLLFKEKNIKYIIIPYDCEKEIFLTDRKYDVKKREIIDNLLQKLSWLEKVNIHGQNAIIIYRIKNFDENKLISDV